MIPENWYLHCITGLAGAIVYYAWARFNPHATVGQPNPKGWGAYLLADWRMFVWGLAGSIAAYMLWVFIYELGFKIDIPAAIPIVGGQSFLFPNVNVVVAFLLGFSGRSLTKLLGPIGKRLGL